LYQIKVQKEGFKVAEAKNVEVVINRSSSVNLLLQPGTVAETVEVSASSVEVDTNSTAIGDNLTSTFYSQVPVQRNVGSLFYVAPGAVNGGGTGNSNPSIGGATGLENSYVADGVSINDSGYGGLGVYSPSYGSLGTGINLSFIQEVQVKTFHLRVRKTSCSFSARSTPASTRPFGLRPTCHFPQACTATVPSTLRSRPITGPAS
jgi:hypothetical protein